MGSAHEPNRKSASSPPVTETAKPKTIAPVIMDPCRVKRWVARLTRMMPTSANTEFSQPPNLPGF